MNAYHFLSMGLVAIIHSYIMHIEMVLGTTEKGIKIFGLKRKQFAEDTKVLAANQG
jgi:putative membrane protein